MRKQGSLEFYGNALIWNGLGLFRLPKPFSCLSLAGLSLEVGNISADIG
jgi:hypothetical protein